jgi:dTDP-4-dehydrorhamnose 3,5-epimerase
MDFIKTRFKGLVVYKGKSFGDNRGFFREVFLNKIVKKELPFLSLSYSKKNVLRGLHTQSKNPQGKFISVIKGKIFDVSVDLRKKSPTYGEYFSIILSDKNCKSIYIPPNFAHGFLTLAEENYVLYDNTEYRNKKSEFGIKWNDKDLKIKWPIKKPILSKKDKKNKNFKDFR